MSNILIVDDEEAIRIGFRYYLEAKEHKVFDAENGIQGIRQFLEAKKHGGIDAILTDIEMPVCNGIEMVNKLYSGGVLGTIPVLYMSGRVEDYIHTTIQSWPNIHWIQKPFSPEYFTKWLDDEVKH